MTESGVPPVFRFGVFELDVASGQLRKNGRRVALQPQPLKVLVTLLERAGAVVPRDDLRRAIWPDDTFVEFDQGLNFCIRQVRAALGDPADSPAWIETVPRTGHRFIGPVSRLDPGAAPTTAPHRPASPIPVPSASDEARSAPSRAKRNVSLPAALFATGAIAGGLVAWALFSSRERAAAAPPADLVRLPITESGAYAIDDLSAPAISQDGSAVAFVASDAANHQSVWVRRLTDMSARALPDTTGAYYPFWSPDGRRIGFFTSDKLRVVDVASGVVESICDVVHARGGTWNRDGQIVFGSETGGLFMVRPPGGKPQAITSVQDGISHRWPSFLPDGRHYLVTVRGADPHGSSISVGVIDSRDLRPLGITADSNAEYAGNRLLYVREDSSPHSPRSSAWRMAVVDRGTLVAQHFDTDRLQVSGDPVPIQDDVRLVSSGSTGFAMFSSAAGRVVFTPAGPRPATALDWIDDKGTPIGTVVTPTFYAHPAISPDGTKVAFDRLDASTSSLDIWVRDIIRGVDVRLTFDPANDTIPVWSPDGSRIVFASDRSGPSDLYITHVGGGHEELLLHSSKYMYPTSWSPDGKYVIYQSPDPRDTDTDVWAVPVDGTHAPFSVVHTEGSEGCGVISPDGRWIAYDLYTVPTVGRIFVEPFPPTGAKWEISADIGGRQPRWSADGRELYFLSVDLSHLMVTRVDGSSATFRYGAPTPLFATTVYAGPPRPVFYYDVAKGGRRFLFDWLEHPRPASPLMLLVNWTR